MKAFRADTDDKDERYTLPSTVELCRRVADVDPLRPFTMDVAASAASHYAPLYYTKENSGLEAEWYGLVWCNPPFSLCGEFVQKAWQEYRKNSASILMLLPSNRTDTKWWQREVEPYRDAKGYGLKTFFLPRQKFGSPGNPEGKPVPVWDEKKQKYVKRYSGAPFGCVLLYWWV